MLGISILSLFILLFAPTLVTAQAKSDENASSTVIYPAAYFDQFTPISIKDMTDRIPGIAQVLNADDLQLRSRDRSDRGLGGSSQILINGKRLAGKVNEAQSQLDRMAASDVDYIEIIRGTSSELDVQNSGQLVNIVLKQSQSRSSLSAELGMQRFRNARLEPVGALALTGQSGNLNYLLSASVDTSYQLEDSQELSLHRDLSPNEIILFERVRDQPLYNLNSNLSYDITAQDRLALNFLVAESDASTRLDRTITDFNMETPSSSFERERLPSTSHNWEIGGDYEHSFSNNAKYKFLFIINDRKDETTRERFEFASIGAPEQKNLFLNNSSRYREKIIRTSYTWNLADGQGLELGIEAAQTTQDSSLKLGLPPAAPGSADFGGLTPVPMPNAKSTVEEIRYEGFAVHNWQLNSRMSLESSLVAEYSKIEQSGDVSNRRNFNFLKPKVDFRFDINSTFQARFSAEKYVAQLSFADFSASTNEMDEDQNTIAGNPELVQEESWRYNLNLDYRLSNDGGVLNARLFYYDIEDVIGRIDISSSALELASTNGNVSDGSVLGLNLNASIRFGFLGLPQALLTAGLLVQDSAIDDPLIGIERKVVPYDRGNYQLGFRHDMPTWNMNYGFNYFHRIDGNRPFWDIDNVLYIGSGSDLTIFVEKVGIAGLTFRFEVINALDHESKRERRRYDGYLRNEVLSEIERFQITNGVRLAFMVRGSF